MSLPTLIYNALAGNGNLDALLARHKLAKEKPAIYEQWAAADTDKPYICLLYSFGDSYHWARTEASVTIDIFTQGDTLKAEAIRNQVIRTLDKQKISGDGEESDVRLFLQSDSIIVEDDPQICHWNIEIGAVFWRNDFVDYLNSIFET